MSTRLKAGSLLSGCVGREVEVGGVSVLSHLPTVGVLLSVRSVWVCGTAVNHGAFELISKGLNWICIVISDLDTFKL